MSKGITVISESTIGLDVSDKHTHGFVVGADGEEVERFRCQSTAKGLQTVMAKYGGSQVVLEVGPHSPWISRLLQSMELEVIVANPRRVRLIADSERKNDRLDAERLARLGRVDARLLSPVRHRSERAQKDLILLKARGGSSGAKAGDAASPVVGQSGNVRFGWRTSARRHKQHRRMSDHRSR